MARFDSTIINARERPLSSDINTMQSRMRDTLRFILRKSFGLRTSASNPVTSPVTGFLADGFFVRPSSPTAMSVVVGEGLGFMDDATSVPSAIGGISGLDDLERYKPLFLSADETIALDPAPIAGQERYDLIEVKYNRLATDATSRDILDTGTGEFAAATVNKTLSWDMSTLQGSVYDPAPSTTPIGVKIGTAAAIGAAVIPSVTSGYTAVAIIYVGPTVTTIDTDVIRDSRRILAPGGAIPFGVNVSVAGAGGVPTVFEADGLEGLRACAVDNFIANGPNADIFIFLPNSIGTDDVHVTGMYESQYAFGNTVDVPGAAATAHAQLSVGVGTVDAALQTRVANVAAALPAMGVAVGQPYVRISVAPLTQTGAVTAFAGGAGARRIRITGFVKSV